MRGDIYVVRADGRALSRLTRDGRNSSPQLAPTGQVVAYLCATPTQNRVAGRQVGHDVCLVRIAGVARGPGIRRITRVDTALDRGGLA